MVAYLNIHTAYDLLNSSLKIEDTVRLAVSENVDALAITDTRMYIMVFLNFMMHV